MSIFVALHVSFSLKIENRRKNNHSEVMFVNVNNSMEICRVNLFKLLGHYFFKLSTMAHRKFISFDGFFCKFKIRIE